MQAHVYLRGFAGYSESSLCAYEEITEELEFFYLKILIFVVKFSIYLNRRVFLMYGSSWVTSYSTY